MSDQVIAEIERSVEDFGQRLGEEVMVIYCGTGLWIVSAHMLGLRARNSDVMVALREFGALVSRAENHTAALAQTLGLGAAE